ncbi:MAG TPA: PQQ-binding-like beta-propeller repeat protein [Candidatus Thermoplasmatota archaeon]|nr:PQQ-binding-like beta-propeller repeat protein [Candidatus Thermoplasmatota archaeon]
MYCHDIRHTGRSSYISTGNWYAEKWKFYMGGWIESSPAIDCNGTIYIGGDYDLCLYAISPGGTEKWRANIGDTLSSPAIGKDNTIYIGTNAGRLYAINANGTIKWWVSLGDGWAYSSPAIDNNGTIYCASTFSNRLAAVYPNGTIKWFFNAQGYIYCSPAIGGDGTIYIGSNDGYLYAINPNGTLNWKYYAGGQKGIATTSIADDGTIYAGGTAGYLYALYSNGTLKWKVYTGWIGGSTPAIADDGTIYVGAQGPNRIYSISPTGTINWYYETNGEILTSPAIDAQGNIYCASDDYNLYALNKNGTLRWAFHAANEDIVSSPVVGENGTIFITGIFWGSGSTPDHSYLFALETINDTNPAIPSITGDENGQVHRKHDYTIASTDPDNDNISYYIDWGDGKSNDWTTPTPSGKAITLSHIWQKKGMYTIKVKARDEHLMESDWGTLSVTMPLAYEQPHFRFFEWLLERFPHAFPFLRLLFHQ